MRCTRSPVCRCLRRHRLPLHFFTDGQEVLQDFGVVDPNTFVDYLFTREAYSRCVEDYAATNRP